MFLNSMISKRQAVFSAIRKASAMSIFDKKILPYEKLESNLKIVKDRYVYLPIYYFLITNKIIFISFQSHNYTFMDQILDASSDKVIRGT